MYCLPDLKKVFVIDGETKRLYQYSLKGKFLKKKTIPCRGGARWHFAGLDTPNHLLYLVLESGKREVTEALRIDLQKLTFQSVVLPGKKEGVGISYNPLREEIYIPYDNHPLLHVVGFKGGGNYTDVVLPTYGNDASAVDEQRGRLYVASWGKGDVYVVDIRKGEMIKRIRNLGIIPHTFSIGLDPFLKRLYIPIGATAVNGSFGASLLELDLVTEKTERIYTGWAPVDRESFLF